MPERAETGLRRNTSNRHFREICHDMRQPIAGVLALAEAALDEPQVPPAALARLRLIVEQAEWLAQMISHGLEAGEQPREPAYRTDAGHAIAEAAASARLVWPGDMDVIEPAKGMKLTIHPVILRRSIANLLDNAMRAAGPAGHVRITAGSFPGWGLIAVEDDGPGFGHIEKGHGLGLATVTRSIVKHGGGVEYTRSSLGGSCVSLWLPLSPEPKSRVQKMTAVAKRTTRQMARFRSYGRVLESASAGLGLDPGQVRLDPQADAGPRHLRPVR
jgi:signal transduction histidine kinase